MSFGSGAGAPGGSDSPIARFAGTLAAFGHDVDLLVSEPSPSARAPGTAPPVRTIVLAEPSGETGTGGSGGTDGSGTGAAVGGSGTVERIDALTGGLSHELDVGDYDIVHSHGWLAGLASQLTVPGRGLPLVHTFGHSLLLERTGRDDGPDTAGARLRAERACAAHADRLIATSTYEQQALLHLGVERRRISVIPPGVAPPETRSEDQRWPGAGLLSPELVAFGPPSRIADVVGCLPALPHAHLLVCGTPWFPVGEVRDDLVGLAAELGVVDRVRLEPGDTSRARAPLIRGAMVALCLAPPARAGIEHLECMALGVPVIAGNAVAAEAVVDGVTGLHALDASPAVLRQSVLKLLERPVQRAQMSMAGQDRAATRYSWERIATETERVYAELTDARPGSGGQRPTSVRYAHKPNSSSASCNT